jgi:hypothetical protein
MVIALTPEAVKSTGRYRKVPDRLHRVGVERDLVRAGKRGQLADRLDGAHLVVRPHDAHQGDAAGPARGCLDPLPQRVGLYPAVAVDRQRIDHGALVAGQPVGRVEDRVVLDRADQQPAARGGCRPARPEDPFDREVVGLGPAAGKDHFARAGAQRLGDDLPGLLHGPPCPAARRVQRRRVAHPPELGGHRLDRLGQHRRGRRVIEIRAFVIHRCHQRNRSSDRAAGHGEAIASFAWVPPGRGCRRATALPAVLATCVA